MTTIVTMLKESVQTGREIKGSIAKVVPDNKRFELIDYDIESGKFIFQEMLEENEERIPEVIIINEDNALVAHLDRNPNPKPDYEAEIISGTTGRKVLKVSDKEVDMGTIKGIKVLCGLKGKVVFTVATTSEDVVDIWCYDVQFDKFDVISTGFGNDIKRIQLGDEVYLLDNIISMEEVLDKDGKNVIDERGQKVRKPVLDSSTLYAVYVINDGLDSKVTIREAYGSNDTDFYDEDEMDKTVPIDDVRVVCQGSRKDIVMMSSKIVDDDGYLVDDNKYTLCLYVYEATIGSRVGTFYVSDPKAKVYLGGPTCKPPVVTVKDKDKIFIRDKFGLKVIDDENVVKELEGYNYFCGTETSKNEKEQQVVTFYYSNDDRTLVKSFTQTFTDRGILYSMN